MISDFIDISVYYIVLKIGLMVFITTVRCPSSLISRYDDEGLLRYVGGFVDNYFWERKEILKLSLFSLFKMAFVNVFVSIKGAIEHWKEG